MTEVPVTKRPNRCPTHPGAILRDTVFPAMEVSIRQAATDLGISRQTLHNILAGKAGITPPMAIRIGKYCGNGPAVWLRMQQAYDLWNAEQEMKDVIKEIRTRKAA